MKAVLEFDLPEECFEHYIAVNAPAYHSVLFDMQYNFFKGIRNYLDSRENATEAEYALLDKMQERFHELMVDNKVIVE